MPPAEPPAKSSGGGQGGSAGQGGQAGAARTRHGNITDDSTDAGESIDGSVATADSSLLVKPKPKQGGLFQDPLEKASARGAGTGGAVLLVDSAEAGSLPTL